MRPTGTAVDRTKVFNAIVLGAGISGLVSASILAGQGSTRVLVVDEYPQVGGNHLAFRFGDYTFDVGSLIFQDDSPLLRHFPMLLPRYVEVDPSWGRLNPQGVVTDYPFSFRDDFLTAGPVECARLVLSAGLARIRHRRPRNARDFARRWVGPRLLHRSGLEKYMERFCGLPPGRIDLEFAEQRMMWIAEHGALAGLLRRALEGVGQRRPGARRRDDGPTNRQLVRPKEGFEALYQAAVRHLEDAGAEFLLGTRPDRLRRDGSAFRLEAGEEAFLAGRVVSTIPVDRARALVGAPTPQPLPTVTLISLFYSFAGDRGFADPILYNFSHSGAWKRLTMYSDFYGRVLDREYFTVEVIGDHVGRSVDRAAGDFRAHAAAHGLFAGDLVLEGSHVLEHAYPIYTEGAGARAKAIIADLRAFGVESFGRQGGFHYQPTARVSTTEAEAALGVP